MAETDAQAGAGAAAERAQATMSIGEVLAILKPEFDDITVSKIRFLEAAGLVRPDRAPSGYRKFSEDDVARLRFVLRAQRDQYLPLRVIRERLADLESTGDLYTRGGPPEPARASAQADTVATGGTAAALGGLEDESDAADGVLARSALLDAPEVVQLSRSELCKVAGADDAQLTEFEHFGLIRAHGDSEHGGWYDGDALLMLQLAGRLAGFGLEARHLRMYKTFADREASLFEQVVAPIGRQRGVEAQIRARATLDELEDLATRMHAVCMRTAVEGLRTGESR